MTLVLLALAATPPQPLTWDPRLFALLNDPKTVVYRHRAAYQDWADGALRGFHDPAYNISAVPSEPHGNPNREFPWHRPAGMRRASGTQVRFVRLSGPVQIWRERAAGEATPGFRWRFPEGTGKSRRLRVRDRFGIFDESGELPVLRRVPWKESERFLRTTPFESTRHQPPRPTADADGIVPKNYEGGLIALSRKSCMRCHDSVNRHAREFDRDRDWYGRVRGGDGIFSWLPVEPSSISPSGTPRPVRLRADLLRRGQLRRVRR